MTIKPTSQYYNPVTKQLEDSYPGGLTAPEYHRSKHTKPFTHDNCEHLIQSLLAENKRLRRKIKRLTNPPVDHSAGAE